MTSTMGMGSGSGRGTKVRAKDLRLKSKEELEKQLAELKQELASLRVSKVVGPSKNVRVTRIRTVRKSVARILTIMNQMRTENLIKFYKGKKFVPKDLKPRLTRAKRRELTKFEKSRELKKVRRRARIYPVRVFALKSSAN
ncbi:hypothetical protein GJ496_011929 [Pomphorhynchus laevis]|nr:hypothetical protein GJ496_006666 [Pomphorhynchus laevis]KAI0984710.1 hypothetical protein GJ496_011929 [Pomphorhynchus laevis]